MTTYGLQTDGTFLAKTQPEILADIEASQLEAAAAQGFPWDVSDPPILAMNTSVANRLAEAWGMASDVHTSRNPPAVTGAQTAAMDNLAQITGTQRQPATFGTVVLQVVGTSGQPLPAGAIASVAGQPSSQWATDAAITFTGAPQSVNATATVAGDIPAGAGTITVIQTPYPGWTSVTNPAAAIPGAPQDDDAALEARRIENLPEGNSTASSIASKLMRATLTGGSIALALVFENDTDVATAVGSVSLPPHSMLVCVVSTYTDAQVAQLIWAQLPDGIATPPGASNHGTVTDLNGAAHTVYFQRVTTVPIYLIVDVKEGPGWNATTTPAAIQAALVAWAAGAPATSTAPAIPPALQVGTSVIQTRLFKPALSVPAVPAGAQVVDCTAIYLGLAPSPAGQANISIGALSLATISAANITVNGTP